MANQQITGEEKRGLLGLCLIAAKQLGYLMIDDTDLHGDRLLHLYKEWGGDSRARDFKPEGTPFDVEGASQNFMRFLEHKAGQGVQAKTKREILIDGMSVTLVVPLGERGAIMYELSGTPPPDADRDEMQDMFQILLNQCVLGYEQQINRPLQLPMKKRFEAKSGDTVNTFDFTSIRSVSEGGKRSYFVKGAPFVKYGVRVFPNVLSAAGIDPETIDGEKFIAGTALYTKRANGDPNLVESIQRRDEVLK